MLSTLAFIRPPQGMEWLIILVVVLLIFGKRLPGVAKSLGKGIVEFKKGLSGADASDSQIEADPAAESRQIT